jgi:hypothetical protein
MNEPAVMCTAVNICMNEDCQYWYDMNDPVGGPSPVRLKHMKDDMCGFRMLPEVAYNRCPTGGCEE